MRRLHRCTATRGRPGIETRFVVGLLLLKHIYDLSDEVACDRWVHDPYSSTSPARRFSSMSFRMSARISAIGARALVQARASAGREPEGGALRRSTAQARSQAGHGGYHGATQSRHLPDRRQAAVRNSITQGLASPDRARPRRAEAKGLSPISSISLACAARVKCHCANSARKTG